MAGIFTSAIDGYNAGKEAKNRKEISDLMKSNEGNAMTSRLSDASNAYLRQGNLEKGLSLQQMSKQMADENYQAAIDAVLAGESPERVKELFNASGRVKLDQFEVEPYEIEMPGFGKVSTARLKGTTNDGQAFELPDAFMARMKMFSIEKQLSLKAQQQNYKDRQASAMARAARSSAPKPKDNSKQYGAIAKLVGDLLPTSDMEGSEGQMLGARKNVQTTAVAQQIFDWSQQADQSITPEMAVHMSLNGEPNIQTIEDEQGNLFERDVFVAEMPTGEVVVVPSPNLRPVPKEQAAPAPAAQAPQVPQRPNATQKPTVHDDPYLGGA